MPSVVGLLEQRELGARRRVDELREEADRVQAELAVAEREWKEWAIACSRVGEVLAPVDEGAGPRPGRGDRAGRRGADRRAGHCGQWCGRCHPHGGSRDSPPKPRKPLCQMLGLRLPVAHRRRP